MLVVPVCSVRCWPRVYPWARCSVTFRYEYETEQRYWQKLARVPKCPFARSMCRMHRDTDTHTRTHLGSECSPLQGYFRSFVLLVVSLVLVRVVVASRFHSIPNESKIGIRSQLVCVPARMWCARRARHLSLFWFKLHSTWWCLRQREKWAYPKHFYFSFCCRLFVSLLRILTALEPMQMQIRIQIQITSSSAVSVSVCALFNWD